MIPTPYTLTVRASSPGPKDDFGNPTTVWTERPWQVHAVAPGASTELYQPNRDMSRIAHMVLAPASDDVPTEADEVLVDGEWFKVDGAPDDYTRGPWVNPVAGVVVMLRRDEG